MRTLFYDLKNSIYNPSFYSERRTAPVGQAMWYFAKLAMLLSAVAAIVITLTLLPKIQQLASELGQTIARHYPAELEIVVADGVASTTAEQPYLVPVPAEEGFDGSDGAIENILVIDTVNEFTQSRFREYKTAAWLTKESLVFQDGNRIEIVPLSVFGDVTINQTVVHQAVTALGSLVKVGVPLLALGIFLGGVAASALYSLYLLLLALLVWLIARNRGWEDVRYSNAYGLTLYAATIPLIIHFAVVMIAPGLPLYFIPTILLIVTALANIQSPRTLAAIE